MDTTISEAVAAFYRRLQSIYTSQELADMANAREAALEEWQHRHDWREYDRNR